MPRLAGLVAAVHEIGIMNTTAIAPEQLLELGVALARADRNLDIMDRTAILHGYLELTRLDPQNEVYWKNVEAAAASLLEAAHNCGWSVE